AGSDGGQSAPAWQALSIQPAPPPSRERLVELRGRVAAAAKRGHTPPMRSFFVLAWFGLAASVLSCGGGEPPPPSTAQSPSVKMPADTIKASPNVPTGVDKSAMDPSVSPCDDFYQYACGSWIQKTPIPGDESGWYRSFSVIEERNEETLHQILESYAKG